MIIQNANVFMPDGAFAKGDIYVDQKTGRIQNVSLANLAQEEVIDASELYAIPGLIDLHFHGCVGHDFCDATEEAIQAIADYEASVGVLAICPATMTYSEEIIAGIVDAAVAHKNGKGADLIGINMEGPFLSPKRAGAQNPEYFHAPDADFFMRVQERAGGLIKLCDIAPEEAGAMECIDAIKDSVQVISLAHTTADYETACEAFQRGANHVTHLYNAMPGIHHRLPGPIVAANEMGATVELITDNIHSHPAIARFTFRVFGDDKVVLVADSMMACGLPNGQYELGGQAVTVEGRKCTLTHKPEIIAGSATNLFDCMRCAVKEMDIPLESAVKAATLNPARVLNVCEDYGSLKEGVYGNVLLLNKELELVHVVQKGTVIR